MTGFEIGFAPAIFPMYVGITFFAFMLFCIMKLNLNGVDSVKEKYSRLACIILLWVSAGLVICLFSFAVVYAILTVISLFPLSFF